jgi:hypothetical protein
MTSFQSVIYILKERQKKQHLFLNAYLFERKQENLEKKL